MSAGNINSGTADLPTPESDPGPDADAAGIWRDREQLALAFRLAERFGFHEGICNHFSVRLACTEELYLINPYGLHWSMMQPDSLLLIDGDGTILEGTGELEDTARFIHIAGHRANPRHRALLHTHMPWATTLTMLDDGHHHLLMAHQTATRFYGRVAYQPEFGGLANDAGEGDRLAAAATSAPEVDVSFLTQHGVVVGGKDVAMAFDDLYYLERACRQQVLAMQTGAPLKILPDHIVKHTCAQIMACQEHYAHKHFEALATVLMASPDRTMTF